MQILVTNDDGIASEGLWRLARALRDAGLGQVTIVAPEEEQSGTGMSLPPGLRPTIRAVTPPDPAYAGIGAFAYSGTPVGCVTAALRAGVAPRPDAVVSGINRGLNTGTNVLLSGTVGAAMIGALWGLPALAVSQQFLGDAPMPWDVAAWAAARVFPLVLELRAHSPLVLNVNVPHLHRREELRGFRQTRLSSFFFGDYVDLSLSDEEDEAGRREVRYRFVRERVPSFPETSDDGAVRAGFVSITPLAPGFERADLALGGLLDGLA